MTAQGPIKAGIEIGGGAIVDADSRMCGRGSQRVTPGTAARRRGAAIDDQTLASRAHLEGQSTGVRPAIRRGGRRIARVDDDRRAARRDAMETRMRRTRRRAHFHIGARQQPVDDRGIFGGGAIEQCESAVAVTERAQKRGHLVDGFRNPARNQDVRRRQCLLERDQIGEDRKLHRRVARCVSAVGKYLTDDLGFQQLQTLMQPAIAVGLADAAIDQAFECCDARRSTGRRHRRAGKMAPLACNLGEKEFEETRLTVRGVESEMRQPVREAGAQDVGPPRKRRPARVACDPLMDEAEIGRAHV